MKKTYTMTPAAKAARMKGSKATADKFARLRAGRDRSTAVVDKSLKNWAIDRFGNVTLALADFKGLCDSIDAGRVRIEATHEEKEVR